MRRAFITNLVLGWVIITAMPCTADDAFVKAVGGSVSSLAEHPTIVLTAEYVHIHLRPADIRVECVFFLQNSGPATTVTVGFPNFSEGAGVEGNVPFTSFVSYVDGDSVGIVVLPDAGPHGYQSYGSWYTKEIAFDAGQRRCVRDVYTGTAGANSQGFSSFRYILWSGATWAGPIGVADIVVTLDPLAASFESLYASPGGYSRSGDEIRWHFTDIEPPRRSETGVINLYWKRGSR